jgi:glycogen synthase
MKSKRFSKGDVNGISQALAKLLRHPEQIADYQKYAAAHLARHHKEKIAQAYIQVFEEAIR